MKSSKLVFFSTRRFPFFPLISDGDVGLFEPLADLLILATADLDTHSGDRAIRSVAGAPPLLLTLVGKFPKLPKGLEDATIPP